MATILTGRLAMIPHTDVGILTQAARHTLDRVKPSPCCRWWEPNWNPWVRLHPDNASAPSRTYSLYSRYRYSSYRTDDSLLNPPQSANPNFFANAHGAKDWCWVCGRTTRPGLSVPEHGAAGLINDATGGVDIVVVWDRDSNIALPCPRGGRPVTDFRHRQGRVHGPWACETARPEPCETWKE